MVLCFIDTNIFMYTVGSAHPHQRPSQGLVQSVLKETVSAAINTEVLQEILYRYAAIGKMEIGFQLFDALIDTFSLIWPVSKEDLIEARKIQHRYQVKTRDAIHAATMKRNGVKRIYSYDRDFDRISGIDRIEP